MIYSVLDSLLAVLSDVNKKKKVEFFENNAEPLEFAHSSS